MGYSIILYGNNGKENGNYYSIMGYNRLGRRVNRDFLSVAEADKQDQRTHFSVTRDHSSHSTPNQYKRHSPVPWWTTHICCGSGTFPHPRLRNFIPLHGVLFLYEGSPRKPSFQLAGILWSRDTIRVQKPSVRRRRAL